MKNLPTGLKVRFFIGLTLLVLWSAITCVAMKEALGEVRKGDGSNYPHIFLGTRPIQKIYMGDTLVWANTNPPTISSFSVSPATIDLDTRLTGTISFSFSVSAQAGLSLSAQIYREPEGVAVGASFTAGKGLPLTGSLPNISQPLKPTTYRLVARNSGGASHSDATVTVTKNPTLTNCRRTGFVDATTLYTFGMTFTGLPRPLITYVFSGGQQGTINERHYTQGANPYTWSFTDFRVTMATPQAQSVVFTATNSQGTATCRIGNIND